MNRRGFLKLLGTAVAVAAIDPEALLWQPGAKTHVLPPPNSWRRDPTLSLFNPPADIGLKYREGLGFNNEAFQLTWPETEAFKSDIAAAARQLADDIDRATLNMLGVPPCDLLAKDSETGLSIRFVREFNAEHSKRMDILYGYPVLRYPEFAVRIRG